VIEKLRGPEPLISYEEKKRKKICKKNVTIITSFL